MGLYERTHSIGGIAPHQAQRFQMEEKYHYFFLSKFFVFFVEDSVDPSVRDSECLRWAARFGHSRVLKLLLEVC